MVTQKFVDLLVELNWDWAYHTEQGMSGIAFKKKFNGKDVKYHLSNGGVERITEEQLRKQLGCHDVIWMSRIVGYFSKINNWNPSKLGELKDRQNGNYAFKEKEEKR